MTAAFEISVPAGLVACRLNGVQRHISAISEKSLCLRIEDGARAEGALEVCFRSPDGRWETVSINDYHAGPVRRDFCGGLIRLSFSSAPYAVCLRKALSFYADYIRAFSEGDVQSLSSYPANLDGVFGPSADFSHLHLPTDREICISLQEPGLYSLYLNHPIQDFLSAYSAEKQTPKITSLHRLYIGNGFCRRLFPERQTLAQLLSKAASENLAVTLVTAPDPRIPEEILAAYSGEMLVSDWGLLHRLQKHPQIEPVLGTLLNKRRKDPRMCCKPDLNPDLLRQSSVNSPEYLAFLQSLGVCRVEFERCGYAYDLPACKCSLHLPFYQTNTSVYCPTRALCEHGDRGAQTDDGGCPGYCLSNGIIFPAHLKLFARWNSLFAVDDRPPDFPPGFDRIVLNL